MTNSFLNTDVNLEKNDLLPGREKIALHLITSLKEAPQNISFKTDVNSDKKSADVICQLMKSHFTLQLIFSRNKAQ
jgi:hypothetical protein